ncbi:hypothetical protein ACFT2C_06080 [Promicromonospora sp. NPDC057138]|uniref:hypothetical protein n=1 Tax=Promicromonospora sp. NPDC057138 TaxID=3346031 RepID=UPI003631125A
MDVARMVLDYVTVLIWPAILVVVLVVYRHPIADVLPRLRRAKAGGFEVELGDATERVNESLEAVDQAGDSDGDVQLTRVDLEKIVRESAAAGWSVGTTLPFRSEPRPVVEWVDGKPRIKYWFARSR